jgi:hypothetical protein
LVGIACESLSRAVTQSTQKEGETLTQEEQDALDERLIRTLEEVGIPPEVANHVHGSGAPKNLERLSDAMAHNFSRPEDKDLAPPVIMLIGRLSKHSVVPFIFPKPAEEDTNELSKVFLDSMRQQLARFFAIARQRLTLPCNLVCPFAWKGRPCCGAKEGLSMLYNRLPEEVRAQVIPPNCDLVR